MVKNLNYTYSSLKGTKHQENWDELLVIDEPAYSLFAVFDGVSSAKHGKEAAINAKHFIKKNYKTYIKEQVNIKRLMFELNQNIINSGLKEPYSTYCIVYFEKESQSFQYSWLGDSRLYIITNQFAEQLTEDDSYSDHIITKFLGSPDLNSEDFRQFESTKLDAHLLLCTDGFYRIFESNKLKFFGNFHKKSLPSIKEKINSFIRGKNFDDSTFIFVK